MPEVAYHIALGRVGKAREMRRSPRRALIRLKGAALPQCGKAAPSPGEKTS